MFRCFLTCAHAGSVASLNNILMKSFSKSEAANFKMQALRPEHFLFSQITATSGFKLALANGPFRKCQS